MMPRLSPGAIELARRCGIAGVITAAQVELHQSGRIRSNPAKNWMTLRAVQTIDLQRCCFDWRATAGPLGAMSIRDALEPGGGKLVVKALGFIPIAHEGPSDALTQGELMRYLAEVAWAPDAILANRDLRWCDHGPRSLTVSAGNASVMLTLDEDGLIAQTFAPDRPRSTPNGMIPTPWRGKFWDYRQIGDRMIPHSASVSWTVDGDEQLYGEFKLTEWRLLPGD